MCGIAGVINPGDMSALAVMVEAMRHRGPDDQGVHQSENGACSLGHTRLSIIDTSAAGHQPMASADERFTIVYNGEVYNFAEIRRELESVGRCFRTATDTEVVLQAYEQWGEEAVSRLRGMFAFAIWDEQAGQLFLARDRLGIKPLYYTIQHGRLLFGSEIKALLASGLVPRDADPQAVAWYMVVGCVPQPSTIVQGVSMFPAGCTGLFRQGELVVRRYWRARDFLAPEAASSSQSFEEAARRLRSLLEDAARLHMIADVPVGAFLSGGVDSRIVVGLMSRVSPHPIRTFSVGFSSGADVPDERSAAAAAAKTFGCDHTEVVLTPESFVATLDDGIAAIDQPSIDGFNTFIVSKAARQDVTVALSGLGGDELFGGYPHMNRFARASAIAPHGWPYLERLFQIVGRGLPGRLRLPVQHLLRDPLDRLSGIRQQMSPAFLRKSLVHSVSSLVQVNQVRAFWSLLAPETPDAGNVISIVELDGYLQNVLLRDCDAMSMAHSLEVRPVLLDHAVCEYAIGLPSRWKNGPGLGKKLLIEACRDVLPPDVEAGTKSGFELPLSSWMATYASERVSAMLRSDMAAALFRPAFLGSLQQAARERNARLARGRLWQCVILLEYLHHHSLGVAL